MVIIGGGTFGLALAQESVLPEQPWTSSNRTTSVFSLLEAGPFSLLEHVQDIPNLQLASPGAAPDAVPIPLPTATDVPCPAPCSC